MRDRDYTLEWEDNTDAGTATVSVKAYSDNYTDTKTAEFTILAAPASGKVTITGADNKVGTELTASVTGNTHILFQFTPLREGRRPSVSQLLNINSNFNSRPCERGDNRHMLSIVLCIYFNSRPCERGDGCNLGLRDSRIISIHAPARGATRFAGLAK